jgi:hypothetical protein
MNVGNEFITLFGESFSVEDEKKLDLKRKHDEIVSDKFVFDLKNNVEDDQVYDENEEKEIENNQTTMFEEYEEEEEEDEEEREIEDDNFGPISFQDNVRMNLRKLITINNFEILD